MGSSGYQRLIMNNGKCVHARKALLSKMVSKVHRPVTIYVETCRDDYNADLLAQLYVASAAETK